MEEGLMWKAKVVDNWESFTVDIYIYQETFTGARRVMQVEDEDELTYRLQDVEPGIAINKPTFRLPRDVFESIKEVILSTVNHSVEHEIMQTLYLEQKRVDKFIDFLTLTEE
jgi:hypothetical protein